MITTIQPICGVQVGVEFYDQVIDDIEVGYFLIDIFILRIQLAWYK